MSSPVIDATVATRVINPTQIALVLYTARPAHVMSALTPTDIALPTLIGT